jgi:hypothetical protein
MRTLAMKLAGQHVPGFRVELVWPLGRPKGKIGKYELALRNALELISQKHGERGAATLTAKEIAKARIKDAEKCESRKLSGHEKNKRIAAETRQIKNEIYLLKRPPVK